MSEPRMVFRVDDLRERMLARGVGMMRLTSHEVDAIELWFATRAAEQGEFSAVTNRHFVSLLIAEVRNVDVHNMRAGFQGLNSVDEGISRLNCDLTHVDDPSGAQHMRAPKYRPAPPLENLSL